MGVECSGLVVGDGQIGNGQISDVEQEGEEELRKKREKGGSSAGMIWAVGAAQSRLPELGWAATCALSLSVSPGNYLKVK